MIVKMQIISSKDNEIIKSIKKLKNKKYRDLNKKYVVEGVKLLEEAIKESAKIENIVVCEECLKDGTIEDKMLYEIAKYDCIYVTENVFKTITEVSTPQGILAVLSKETKKEKEENIDFNEDLIVILDGVQDPGNLGTILRTVDSCNLKQIIISENTADSYNPKVVRSTMGAIFRVNIIEIKDISKTIENLKNNGFQIVATALSHDDKSIYDVDFRKKAIVIGNEANGVSKEVLDLADIKAKIPMMGKTESLNASVATGIVLYEYVRQKISNDIK